MPEEKEVVLQGGDLLELFHSCRTLLECALYLISRYEGDYKGFKGQIRKQGQGLAGVSRELLVLKQGVKKLCDWKVQQEIAAGQKADLSFGDETETSDMTSEEPTAEQPATASDLSF